MQRLSGEGQEREEDTLAEESEDDQRDDGNDHLQREQRFGEGEGHEAEGRRRTEEDDPLNLMIHGKLAEAHEQLAEVQLRSLQEEPVMTLIHDKLAEIHRRTAQEMTIRMLFLV